MKLDLTGSGVLALAAVAAVGAAAWLIWSKRGAIAAAAGQAAQAVNPASDQNVVNRAVSAAGEAVTGERGWSLGGQLAEWFDPATRAANAMMRERVQPIASPVDQAIMDANDSRARRGTGAGRPIVHDTTLRSPEESWFAANPGFSFILPAPERPQ